MFNEILELPMLVGEIKNPEIYYSAHHGSSLIFTLFDGTENLVARGMGMQWNENYQMTPVMEWGQRYCLEIVDGAMQPGQLTINGMNFLQLNDTLPTYRNLIQRRELTGIVQIAEHEKAEFRGLVIDVFQGVKIGGQSGNWNAQSLYLRNANMMYRKRLTGLEWLAINPDLGAQTASRAAYPAANQQ